MIVLMFQSDLSLYIAKLREQKISEPQIKNSLIQGGWSEKDVDNALISTGQSELTIPAPPVPHFSMWVSFQYIILFICLYVSATSFGGILHQMVDEYLPDALENTGYTYYGDFNDYLLKGYIAGIIVTYPLFAFLFIWLKKQILKQSKIKSLRARKVLIYFTLVVTFLFMICHLIATLYSFLGGTAGSRSFAHLGVTFFVAGSIFVYLINEVREDRATL
jgi:hypothetical protein